MLATEAPASVSGGVELGPVLITSPREGRGVLRPGMKAAPSATERSTPPLRVIRDVKESIVSVWGGEAGHVSFTIKIVPQRQHDRHKTIETLGSIPTEEASVAGMRAAATKAKATIAVATAPIETVRCPSPLNEPGVAESLPWYRRDGGVGSIPTEEASVAGMRAAATKAKATIAVATAPIETVRCPSPLNEPGVAESLAWYRRDGGVGSIPTEETSVADVRAAVTEAKAAAAAAASSVASDRFPSPLSEPGITKNIPWYRRDGGAGSIPNEKTSVAGVRLAATEAKATVAAAASSVASVRFPSPLNEPGFVNNLSWYRRDGGAQSIPTEKALVAGVRVAATKTKADVAVTSSSVASERSPSPLNEPEVSKNLPWYRRDVGAQSIPTEEASVAGVRVAATKAKADVAVTSSSVAPVSFPSPLNEPGVANSLSWYRRDGGAGLIPTEETSIAAVRMAATEAKADAAVAASPVAFVRFPSLLNEPGAVKSLSLYRRDGGAGSVPTEETSAAGVRVAAIEAKTAVEVPSSSVASVRFPSLLNEPGAVKSLSLYRRDGGAGSVPTEETSAAGVRVAAVEAKTAVEVPSSSVAFVRFPSLLNEAGVTKSLSWYRRNDGAGSIPTEETSVAGVRVAATEAKAAVGVSSSSVASERSPSPLNEP